jgi:hypothetical protein
LFFERIRNDWRSECFSKEIGRFKN